MRRRGVRGSEAGRKRKRNVDKLEESKGGRERMKGLGAKDAVSLLENMGLDVIVSGRGKVVEQSILAGSKIKQGSRIIIKLG